MHKLQIIYTLEDRQLLANFPFEKSILRTKKTLIEFAKAAMLGNFCFSPDGWKEAMFMNKGALPESVPSIPRMIKLSLCVIQDRELEPKKLTLPKWYNECRGKIWEDELNPIPEPANPIQ